ncbi:uncharacterized protein LOC132174416 [Corylus avellana]|uniref:uncharacterized protein LOC132174416 n=1 Tax=Corylus avellana TaxID=13451 RepID=UPI00286A07CA|nr:uncharacterized protein LOC132174416 [Corylus avellana]
MVKMFLWRALNNLLSTKGHLRRKGVVQDSACPLCGLEEENVAHVLWNCPPANGVWGCGSIKFQKRCCGGTNFFNIFEDIVKRCDRFDVERFAVTGRRLWLRRNAVIHGEPFVHPNQIMREVGAAIEDFQRANMVDEHETRQAQKGDSALWQPPPVNSVKINWDATVDHRNGRIRLGCVVQNS